MSKIIVRPAIIKSYQGTNPGPSSGISYTVEIGFDVNTITVPGVIPHNERWPDTYDIYATKPGTAIVCHEFEGGSLQFYFWEWPAVVDCEGE